MMDQEGENQEWIERLQASGYRVTGPRRAIVEIVAQSKKPLSPLEIYEVGRRSYAGLGLVTVYRTLEKLEDLGLVQRLHQPDGCHMVMRACQGHQHVLLCTKCGRAEFFSGDDLSLLIQTIHEQKGFEIQDHWLQFFGVCSNCQKTE